MTEERQFTKAQHEELAKLKADHEAAISERKEEIAKLRAMIAGDAVKREAVDAIRDHGGFSKVLLPHVLDRLDYNDEAGQVFVKDSDGAPSGLTVGELLEGFKEDDELGGFFTENKSTTASGHRSRRNITLTREEAADPAKYRAAKARAAEEGVDFKVEPVKEN